jgi:hypothetical protein
MTRRSLARLAALAAAVVIALPCPTVTAETEAQCPPKAISLVESEHDAPCAVELAPSLRDTTGRNDDLEIAEKDECPG